jgi:AcrR family transcriptional regulator
MPTKGDQTRIRILHQSAQLFNQHGYAATSFSDIMNATGLQKGGVFNHFAGKDALTLAAFDYAFEIAKNYFIQAVESKTSTIEQLIAIVEVFKDFSQDTPLPGGCPLLNTAIESDDANPVLRERTQGGMAQWHGMIARLVRRGIASGEIRDGVDPQKTATVMIAILEGAVMLTKLYGDLTYMQRVIEHLTDYVNGLRA